MARLAWRMEASRTERQIQKGRRKEVGGSKDGGRGSKNTDRTPIEFIGYAAMCSMECHCQAPKAGSGRGALLFSPSRFKASSLFYLIH